MRSNWMPIALALSLGLNLLVAGVFIGARLRPDVGPPPHPAIAIGRAVRSLDPHDQSALQPRVARFYRDIRPHLRDLRRQERALQRAFGAQDFDEAAVDEAHEALTRELVRIQRLSNDTLKDLATDLNGAERAALIEALRDQRHPHRRSLHRVRADGGPGQPAAHTRPEPVR